MTLAFRFPLCLVGALLVTHLFTASSGPDAALDRLAVAPIASSTPALEIATLPKAPLRQVRDFSLTVPIEGSAVLPTLVPASLPTLVPVSLPTQVPIALPMETPTPLQAMAAAERDGCDPAYPEKRTCIPPGPPFAQGCAITGERRFDVLPPDPQRLDADGDGIGCEPMAGT